MDVQRCLEGGGLLACTPDHLIKKLDDYTLGSRSRFRRKEGLGPDQALDFLDTLTFPATRHLVFGVGPHTVWLNNARDGSDLGSDGSLLARHLEVRVVRFVDSVGRAWESGGEKGVTSYEARIFELYDPAGNQLRSVLCSHDGGRWSFSTQGEPLDCEADFPYDARRQQDRFTSEHLARLLKGAGFSRPTADDFRGSSTVAVFEEELLDADWAAQVQARACSVAERDHPAFGYLQRALDFLRHKSLAASAISDLETALRLDPNLAARVEPLLKQARKAAW